MRLVSSSQASDRSGCTRAIVAHLVGTIMDADQIISVSDQGESSDAAARSCLMETNDIYRKLQTSRAEESRLDRMLRLDMRNTSSFARSWSYLKVYKFQSPAIFPKLSVVKWALREPFVLGLAITELINNLLDG